MNIVFMVAKENKQKAEDVLKKDDLVNRGSITIRIASSLDIDEDCYFIIIDAPEEAIEKSKELLKGMADIYEKSDKVISKVKEQEDAATQGFGNILE